jgi:hypothetical protein
MREDDTAGAPRLLNLHQAADYLGVSYWSVRDYVLADLIPTVALPALRPREGAQAGKTLRRVLIDREDLDAFVAGCKHSPAGAPSAAPSNLGHSLGHSTRAGLV